MRKDIFRLAGVAAVLITASVIAAGYYLRAQRADREERVAEQSRADDSIFVRPHSRSRGPQDAKVTVVEFMDPECESCRAMHPIVADLFARYEGRVRFVIRYMPLRP